MIYFNSKYLSDCLGVNLSKWKRWSREFLPPDPLGGYQSGYARQFSNKDAFKVFFGGYLVSELKFTITDAARILSDLHSWLTRHRFYALPIKNPKPPCRYHHIYIYRLGGAKFGYAIRSLTEPALAVKENCYAEHFGLKLIGLPPEFVTHNNDFIHAAVLSINALHQRYLSLVYQE
jgi:hypothetical protein